MVATPCQARAWRPIDLRDADFLPCRLHLRSARVSARVERAAHGSAGEKERATRPAPLARGPRLPVGTQSAGPQERGARYF